MHTHMWHGGCTQAHHEGEHAANSLEGAAMHMPWISEASAPPSHTHHGGATRPWPPLVHHSWPQEEHAMQHAARLAGIQPLQSTWQISSPCSTPCRCPAPAAHLADVQPLQLQELVAVAPVLHGDEHVCAALRRLRIGPACMRFLWCTMRPCQQCKGI